MAMTSNDQVPRGALIAVGCVVGLALFLAVLGRTTGIGVVETGQGEPVVERALHFQDWYDGSVRVVDATTDATIVALPAGEGGFIRGVLRGFARARARRSVDSDAPMLLQQLADGSLYLDDPASGRRVPLDGFGATNRQAFAQLLPPAHEEPHR